MEIISRARWGARHPNGFHDRRLPATQAWLHHSVTIAPDVLPPFDDDYAAIRAIEAIGQDRFGGGMSYTRLFTPVGLIFEGHGIGRSGSHTANRNDIAVGYCLVGNYENQRPTDAQIQAIAWCLQHDYARGWLDAPRLDGGHRDLKSTACPGRYGYAAIGRINALAAGGPITEEDDVSYDDAYKAISDYMGRRIVNPREDAAAGATTTLMTQIQHSDWRYVRTLRAVKDMLAPLYDDEAKAAAAAERIEQAISVIEAGDSITPEEHAAALAETLPTAVLTALRDLIREGETE